MATDASTKLEFNFSKMTAEDFFAKGTSTAADSDGQKPKFDLEKVKQLPWFYDRIAEIPPKAQQVFEQYVGLKPEEVEDHIIAVRNKAFQTFPYPCIGGFRFLDLSISKSPAYDTILSKLKSSSSTKLLDLGCCFAQDLRILHHDGVPSEQLYGSDLEQTFIDSGYELFRDRSTFKATFYAADVFDPNSTMRKELQRKMDIVHCGSFLHLFSWDQQLAVLEAVCDLLKDEVGTMVAGRQMGAEKGQSGEYQTRMKKDQNRFRHDGDSFEKLWKTVAEKRGKGEEWDVQTIWGRWGKVHGWDEIANEADKGRDKWDNSDMVRFQFVVQRVK